MKPEQQLLEWCKHKLAELTDMAKDIELGTRLPRSHSNSDLEELDAEYRSLLAEIAPLSAFVQECAAHLEQPRA